ncbi:putative ribosomal RNA-processing protein 12 [Blattamonas nauphoetae]|uniref:Ribosomal RNA-processing protein 12 n=1 Tax=Blattamonas nauphoetae TaxID=2049346 RepID=A0ABQ9Y1Z0_9EUKA|nr:putative ribosomal RNA-processing protein 12 [Blattamonas nauphoetae]
MTQIPEMSSATVLRAVDSILIEGNIPINNATQYAALFDLYRTKLSSADTSRRDLRVILRTLARKLEELSEPTRISLLEELRQQILSEITSLSGKTLANESLQQNRRISIFYLLRTIVPFISQLSHLTNFLPNFSQSLANSTLQASLTGLSVFYSLLSGIPHDFRSRLSLSKQSLPRLTGGIPLTSQSYVFMESLSWDHQIEVILQQRALRTNKNDEIVPFPLEDSAHVKCIMMLMSLYPTIPESDQLSIAFCNTITRAALFLRYRSQIEYGKILPQLIERLVSCFKHKMESVVETAASCLCDIIRTGIPQVFIRDAVQAAERSASSGQPSHTPLHQLINHIASLLTMRHFSVLPYSLWCVEWLFYRLSGVEPESEKRFCTILLHDILITLIDISETILPADQTTIGNLHPLSRDALVHTLSIAIQCTGAENFLRILPLNIPRDGQAESTADNGRHYLLPILKDAVHHSSMAFFFAELLPLARNYSAKARQFMQASSSDSTKLVIRALSIVTKQIWALLPSFSQWLTDSISGNDDSPVEMLSPSMVDDIYQTESVASSTLGLEAYDWVSDALDLTDAFVASKRTENSSIEESSLNKDHLHEIVKPGENTASLKLSITLNKLIFHWRHMTAYAVNGFFENKPIVIGQSDNHKTIDSFGFLDFGIEVPPKLAFPPSTVTFELISVVTDSIESILSSFLPPALLLHPGAVLNNDEEDSLAEMDEQIDDNGSANETSSVTASTHARSTATQSKTRKRQKSHVFPRNHPLAIQNLQSLTASKSPASNIIHPGDSKNAANKSAKTFYPSFVLSPCEYSKSEMENLHIFHSLDEDDPIPFDDDEEEEEKPKPIIPVHWPIHRYNHSASHVVLNVISNKLCPPLLSNLLIPALEQLNFLEKRNTIGTGQSYASSIEKVKRCIQMCASLTPESKLVRFYTNTMEKLNLAMNSANLEEHVNDLLSSLQFATLFISSLPTETVKPLLVICSTLLQFSSTHLKQQMPQLESAKDNASVYQSLFRTCLQLLQTIFDSHRDIFAGSGVDDSSQTSNAENILTLLLSDSVLSFSSCLSKHKINSLVKSRAFLLTSLLPTLPLDLTLPFAQHFLKELLHLSKSSAIKTRENSHRCIAHLAARCVEIDGGVFGGSLHKLVAFLSSGISTSGNNAISSACLNSLSIVIKTNSRSFNEIFESFDEHPIESFFSLPSEFPTPLCDSSITSKLFSPDTLLKSTLEDLNPFSQLLFVVGCPPPTNRETASSFIRLLNTVISHVPHYLSFADLGLTLLKAMYTDYTQTFRSRHGIRLPLLSYTAKCLKHYGEDQIRDVVPTDEQRIIRNIKKEEKRKQKKDKQKNEEKRDKNESNSSRHQTLEDEEDTRGLVVPVGHEEGWEVGNIERNLSKHSKQRTKSKKQPLQTDVPAESEDSDVDFDFARVAEATFQTREKKSHKGMDVDSSSDDENYDMMSFNKQSLRRKEIRLATDFKVDNMTGKLIFESSDDEGEEDDATKGLPTSRQEALRLLHEKTQTRSYMHKDMFEDGMVVRKHRRHQSSDDNILDRSEPDSSTRSEPSGSQRLSPNPVLNKKPQRVTQGKIIKKQLESFGTATRSKKSGTGGDVKLKGQPDPFSYLPINPATLNKRNKVQTQQGFKNLMKNLSQKHSRTAGQSFDFRKQKESSQQAPRSQRHAKMRHE